MVVGAVEARVVELEGVVGGETHEGFPNAMGGVVFEDGGAEEGPADTVIVGVADCDAEDEIDLCCWVLVVIAERDEEAAGRELDYKRVVYVAAGCWTLSSCADLAPCHTFICGTGEGDDAVAVRERCISC